VNKKLSYRGQNALNVIKTHTQYVLNLPPSSFCQYLGRARCAGLRAGLAAARHRAREAQAPGCGPLAVYKGGGELPGEDEPYVSLMFGLTSVFK